MAVAEACMRQLKENTLKFRRENLLKDKLKKNREIYSNFHILHEINHYLFIFLRIKFVYAIQRVSKQYIFNIQKHQTWLNFILEYF